MLPLRTPAVVHAVRGLHQARVSLATPADPSQPAAIVSRERAPPEVFAKIDLSKPRIEQAREAAVLMSHVKEEVRAGIVEHFGALDVARAASNRADCGLDMARAASNRANRALDMALTAHKRSCAATERAGAAIKRSDTAVAALDDLVPSEVARVCQEVIRGWQGAATAPITVLRPATIAAARELRGQPFKLPAGVPPLVNHPETVLGLEAGELVDALDLLALMLDSPHHEVAYKAKDKGL